MIRFDARPQSALGELPYATYRRVVKAAFGSRRKTLRNALRHGGIIESDDVLAQAGIDPGRRGETLSVAEFVALGKQLVRRPL